MAAKKAASNTITGGDCVSSGVGRKITEDWTRFGKKQILSIGRKRVHDDDDHGISDDALADEFHSSSDEEGGRTSTVMESRRKIKIQELLSTMESPAGARGPGVIEAEPFKKKKKKKKGRKERSKDHVTEVEAPKETSEDERKNGNDAGNPSSGNSKRKRKKARSRQKNIRKDRRPENDRPSHLVLGRPDYRGRPLTEETRKNLGLETVIDTAVAPSSIYDAFDGGEWVGGDKPADVADGSGGGTAEGEDESVSEEAKDKNVVRDDTSLMRIGDCIVSKNVPQPDHEKKQDVGENTFLIGNNDRKKKKKQQKRKFKNLIM